MRKEIIRWLFCWLLLCSPVCASFLLQGIYADGSNVSEQLQNAGLSGKIKLIWGFHEGIWRLYAGDNFSVERYGLLPLTEIKPGYGYWVGYRDNMESVSVYSSETSPVAVSISGHGYVPIDFRLGQEQNFAQFVSGLTVENGTINDLTEIWVYNPDSESWFFYSGQSGNEYSSLYPAPQVLKPGDALWVKTVRSELVLRPYGTGGTVFEVQASVAGPVPLPELLELESSSCVLFTGEQFDLSTVGASVRYTDNTSETVQNVQWSVQTADGGSIEAFSYTAPLTVGSFVLRASYMEGGVTKTADFTAMVQRKPDKLFLSVTSAEIFAGESFNLSALTVQADYLHDVPAQILSADQINWQKLSGSGILAEGVYASSTSSGVAVLRASYTENGVTANADLSIEVFLRPLSLQLDHSSIAVFVNENYDLAQIITRLDYEYGLYEFLSSGELTWSIVSGGGSILQGIYSAPSTTGPVILRTAFSSRGTVLTTDLLLDILRKP